MARGAPRTYIRSKVAYLIMRVEPAENDTLPEHEMLPVVEQIATRCRLDAEYQPGYYARVREVLSAHGYEVPENWVTSGLRQARITEALRKDRRGK